MTATEIKHRARREKWMMAIGECRSSGLTVRAWCQQKGVTPTTYYRWEREVLSLAGATVELPGREFVELPAVEQEKRKEPERSATLWVGENSIELYQELSPAMLKSMVEALRTC